MSSARRPLVLQFIDGALGTGARASYQPPSRRAEKSGVWRLIMRWLGIGAVQPEEDAQIDSGGLVWPQLLALNVAAALVLAACAANASRVGQSWAVPGFYCSIALMFAPIAARLVLVNVSRTERIANLMIVTLGLFALRVIRAPVVFVGHDEYLHWVGAQQIMEDRHLFAANVLFPIGPYYPGLEIVATAFANLSGLSFFASAILVLMVARSLFIGALFLIYERISGSARVAALGCLFYMGSSTFVFFDTNFSYASLAMFLLTLALLLDLRLGDDGGRWLLRLPLFLVALCALSMTHHVTAYALGFLLLGFFLVEAIRRDPREGTLWRCGVTAALAVLVPVLWSKAMGNPGAGYLGPVFQNGLREVSQFILHLGESNRKLFTGDDGVVAPLWQRVLTLGSVGFICVGLALGFFRSLSWAGLFSRRSPSSWPAIFSWSNSRHILLTLITIGYPVSMVFRMTRSGWEIGNRIGPFAFLGVGLVLAICVTSLLQGKSGNVLRAAAIGAAMTVILIGGIISSEGPRILVPARYQVSADGASIEPMGIRAAEWTKEWLGPGNRFAADRVNRLLLAGFGRQLVSTTLQHGYDAGVTLAAPTFGDEELDVIRKLGMEYLFADLRLTTGRPVVGAYFDGARADEMLDAPPLPAATFKYDSIGGVNRIFDNGYSIIYDVRALSGRP